MPRKYRKVNLTDKGKFLLSAETPFSIAEEYKAARINLFYALSTAESKIAVVSSSLAGEGKSTVCVNLAMALAQTDESVLVIDADMRRPAVHNFFDLDNKKGLSDVLSGITNEISDILHKNIFPNLDVITSGPIPPNPAELLVSKRMKRLMELVDSQYNYILIDTPPIGVVSDPLLLNSSTAGILMVVGMQTVSHKNIVNALRKVQLTEGRILGFIKNAC